MTVFTASVFFTARVKSRPNDPSQPQRQQTYLRALGTLPSVEIYYGTFRDGTKTLPLVNPPKQGSSFAKVKVSEEKGSDVNLATRLLVDGFNQQYEQAVVISNDSDLTAPIRFVRDDLMIPVVVVNPDYNNRTAKDIQKSATRIKRLRKSHLRNSQLPTTLSDSNGKVTKPNVW